MNENPEKETEQSAEGGEEGGVSLCVILWAEKTLLFECFFRVWLLTPFLRHNSLNVSRETCSCWIAKVKEGKVRPEKRFQCCSLEKILHPLDQISYSGALISDLQQTERRS